MKTYYALLEDVCVSQNCLFFFYLQRNIYFNSLFMDDEKRKVRFSFLFEIFYNLFSITCPLAKEMSSILTTAYCP